MQRWDFFSSVIASQDSQKRLSEWTDFLQSTQVWFYNSVVKIVVIHMHHIAIELKEINLFKLWIWEPLFVQLAGETEGDTSVKILAILL